MNLIFKDSAGVTEIDPRVNADRTANTGRVAMTSKAKGAEKEAEAG